MRKLLTWLCLSLLALPLKAQEIPATYSNIGSDENGIYLQLENKRIYAEPANDQFRFSDLYSNITGNEKGLDL